MKTRLISGRGLRDTWDNSKMQNSKDVLEGKVAAFNKMHPVGSNVIVVKDLGEQVEATVLHPASILGGHTAVAWFSGIPGCYNLDRVQ
jgi:hypothetical protein